MKLSFEPTSPSRTARGQNAFTLVEIAISLAVIAFALVAIIGVLPLGLSVQRENREETIINQDAAFFAGAIRNGSFGLDDLTNYVFAITNYVTEYDENTNRLKRLPPWGHTYLVSTANPRLRLTNGYNIIGLMSTPKYTPTPNGRDSFFSNHVVGFVRALSGLAVEKAPQNNIDVRQDAFAYRLICENLPLPVSDPGSPFSRQLSYNLHELRLTFRWPLQVNGSAGNGRLTFRTQVSGSLTNDPPLNDERTWFFQPQTFTQAPP